VRRRSRRPHKQLLLRAAPTAGGAAVAGRHRAYRVAVCHRVMVFTDLVRGVEPAIQSLHVYVVLTAEGSSIGHDLPAVELEGDAVRGRSRPDGRLQPTDGPAVHAADAGDGAGEQALALLPRLSAELDDLAEDEGVLGQRAEHEQDARQQPYLKRRHLTRNRNSNPENELKHTFPVARISGSN
jgi:hypothetical protein